MTRLWQGEKVVPATKVTVGPCRIAQIKTAKNDGYDAVQLAYGERKAKNIAKPQLGHTEGLGNFRWLREFRYNFAGRPQDKIEFDRLARGDIIDASTFAVGDLVNVVGHSKGRGFQGVVKRHGFHGHNTTHGTKDQVRMPGSIGAGEPQHVFKGTRMAGRMGNEQVTVQNLEIIEVNLEDNTILIKGGLPGARNSLVLISGNGELAVNKESSEPSSASSSAEAMEDKKATEDKPAIKAEPAEAVKETAEPARNASPASNASRSDAGRPSDAGGEVKEPVKAETEVMPEKTEIKAEALVEAKIVEKKAEEALSVSSRQAKAETAPVVKPEPEKIEAVKIEKTVETVKPAEAKPVEKDLYLKMFDNIPQAERDKLSSPEALAAITALEEAYKIDLLPILAKLATKEVVPDNLAAYLVAQLKLEQAKAEEIANAIKEKKLC